MKHDVSIGVNVSILSKDRQAELDRLNEMSDAHSFFMDWANANISPLTPNTPNSDEIRRRFNQYLKDNNIDRTGTPLPSIEL